MNSALFFPVLILKREIILPMLLLLQLCFRAFVISCFIFLSGPFRNYETASWHLPPQPHNNNNISLIFTLRGKLIPFNG